MSRRTVKRMITSWAAILLGLALSAGMLFLFRVPQPLHSLKALMLSGFSSPNQAARLILSWALLLLTGLSAALCGKAGVMNLGVPGQWIAGAMATLTGAVLLGAPWWACVLLGMLGGFLWGALFGWLTVRFQMHQVLSSVSLIGIALHGASWLWEEVLSAHTDASLHASLSIPQVQIGSVSLSLALPAALLCCLIAWIILKAGVFGFEVKAGGANPEAAKRTGMPLKRNILLVCCLSGGLAGISGAVCVLSGMLGMTLAEASALYGFSGVIIALLSFHHPLAAIPLALYTACAAVGKDALIEGTPQELVWLLLSLTLYSFVLLRPVWKKK